MKNLISIPAIIFIFLCVFGCNLGTTESGTSKNENVNKSTVADKKDDAAGEKPVRSTELIEAFKKDKAAANAKYKDKIILISGKITNINDVFGVKALNLRDAED